MENEEQKPVEEVIEEVKEELAQSEPEAKAERPEINYKMEIERRKAEAEQLRRELEAEKSKQTNRYDANDITTWSDTELHALKNSMDPNHARYKAQAEDILIERRIDRGIEKRQALQKRATTEATLRSQYPEALDQSSEFAAKMEQVMYDLDLQKSPAGRLAAARIVAAETQKGTGKANVAGRKAEEARLKDVKQTLSEGDRPDPRATIPNPKKTEEIVKRLNSNNLDTSAGAMGEILKAKGIDANSFFGRK